MNPLPDALVDRAVLSASKRGPFWSRQLVVSLAGFVPLGGCSSCSQCWPHVVGAKSILGRFTEWRIEIRSEARVSRRYVGCSRARRVWGCSDGSFRSWLRADRCLARRGRRPLARATVNPVSVASIHEFSAFSSGVCPQGDGSVRLSEDAEEIAYWRAISRADNRLNPSSARSLRYRGCNLGVPLWVSIHQSRCHTSYVLPGLCQELHARSRRSGYLLEQATG